MRNVLATLLFALAIVGCSGNGSDGAQDRGDEASDTEQAEENDAGDDRNRDDGENDNDQRYPDVQDATAEPEGEKTYTFEVTISSPYDSPDRYADGWRVISTDGKQKFGVHTLMHDHANEQPFTRTQNGVQIPAGVDEVVVQGRDQQHGFGGETVTVQLPDR